MRKKSAILVLLMAGTALFAQNPVFTVQPALVKVSDTQWTVTFTVDRATDVEVSIVNVADSSVIRHLAAGMLGPKAPAPLAKDALSQSLIWNGKDDIGRAVSLTGKTVRARVRAGMKPELVALFGDDPGVFYTPGILDGIVVAPDGYFYACGMPAFIHQEHYIKDYKVVRKFDRDGNYVKTVFPPPANLTLPQVQGWGAKGWPDGSYSLLSSMTSVPGLSTTIMATNLQPGGSCLLMINKTGELVFGSATSSISFNTDGSIASGTAKALVTTPPLPGSRFGMTYITPLPGSGKLLFSGVFHGTGGHLEVAPDTHFYRDGRVFKVDPATGAAQVFLSLDSVPQLAAERVPKLGGGEFYASIHGTAVDSSGRVFVCNRLHKQIGVYDSNGAKLGAIPLSCPENVAVSKKTGAIFAMTRYQSATGSTTGYVRLYKFAPFDQGAAKLCSVIVLASTVYNRPNKGSVALEESGARTRVIAGINRANIKVYEDQGSSLSLVKDLAVAPANLNVTYDRLCVDRRYDLLYVNDGRANLFKISNWVSPKLQVCSTSLRKPLYGSDMSVSFSGHLYVRSGTSYSGPITRYSTDWYHAPVNYANTGKNVVVPFVDSRDGSVIGERGFAAAPDGRLAVLHEASWNKYLVDVYGDSGRTDSGLGKVQISPIPGNSGGVRYDVQGNLYVGAVIRTADHAYPSPFAGSPLDPVYRTAVGSVVKFTGTDSGSITSTVAANSAKVYGSAGLSPFSSDPSGGCVCHTPRFEVDPYGRLFLPNAVTSQVSVLDNEGTLLMQFGKYGNSDSRGGFSGPGNLLLSPDIPLLWPASAVASEDYIYVADMANCRLARVKMNFALDNIPGLTERMKTEEKALLLKAPAFGLFSAPVPFNRTATVNVKLPGRLQLHLAVYDTRGRLLKKLGEGEYAAGLHRFMWNGTDARNATVAAGLYVYKLTASNQVLVSKTLFTR